MADWQQQIEIEERQRWEQEQHWQIEDPACEEWLKEYEQEMNREDSEHYSSGQWREGVQETSTRRALRHLQHDGRLRDAAGLSEQAAAEGLHPLGGH
jgi:hypothetical protein